MADNLTQSPEKVMVDMINRTNLANGVALTTAMVTFGEPTAPTEVPALTNVTVSAVAGSGYMNSVDVIYSRLDLDTDIGAVAGLSLEFPVGDATLISEIIPEFNTRFGLNLTAADFVDGPVPTFTGVPNETRSMVITAAANSLLYIGTVTITLDGDEIDLAHAVLETELHGLTYEAPVVP